MAKKINPNRKTITAGGKTYKRKYNGDSCDGCAFFQSVGDDNMCTMDKLTRMVTRCGASIWVEADENKHEIKIPKGCEVDTITTENGSVVITFKAKEPQYPKTWEEFCEMYPIKKGECRINFLSEIVQENEDLPSRNPVTSKDLIPDRATAEAVLALCQLIQLRNCYNQGWVPNWSDDKNKYLIVVSAGEIMKQGWRRSPNSPLYFKTAELRELFLENFRDLIMKLSQLYGIKKGGEE